jgi:hypothetical protein
LFLAAGADGGRVDGIIVMSDHRPQLLAVSLPTLGIPVAVIGRSLQPSQAPYIEADNRDGACGPCSSCWIPAAARSGTSPWPPDMVASVDDGVPADRGIRHHRGAASDGDGAVRGGRPRATILPTGLIVRQST